MLPEKVYVTFYSRDNVTRLKDDLTNICKFFNI